MCVEYDARGVKVNDYLQTTNPQIYAAGDICMDWKFTHAADAAARIVIKNTLFSPLGLGRAKLSDVVMPWCTYTDPEIAHVGLYEAEAQQQGIATKTIKIELESVDRAIADGETQIGQRHSSLPYPGRSFEKSSRCLSPDVVDPPQQKTIGLPDQAFLTCIIHED